MEGYNNQANFSFLELSDGIKNVTKKEPKDRQLISELLEYYNRPSFQQYLTSNKPVKIYRTAGRC